MALSPNRPPQGQRKELDVTNVAKAIKGEIVALTRIGDGLKDKGLARANAMVEYDRALAIAIAKLRDEGIQATLATKLAAGEQEVLDARLGMEIADIIWKATNKQLDSVQAKLNGWQSIFRHLEQM